MKFPQILVCYYKNMVFSKAKAYESINLIGFHSYYSTYLSLSKNQA